MSVPVRFDTASAIECLYEDRPWPWAEANQDAIAAHWSRLVAEQPALFNGEVLVLRQGGVEAGVYRGTYSRTRYAAFLYARDVGYPDTTTRNAFAMGALRSRDGAFLLGIMGSHTANRGRIYFPAGTPDLSDVVDGRVDLAGSVARELHEETGLDPADLVFGDPWTVIDHFPRVALIRPVGIDLSAAEAKRLIEANLAAQEEPELSGIHIVASEADLDEDRMPEFMCAYLRRELGRG